MSRLFAFPRIFILIACSAFLISGEDEKQLGSEYTIPFFIPAEFSSLSLSVFVQSEHDQSQPGFTAVWWPTSNLALSGAFLPEVDTDNINAYLNVGFRYLPEINLPALDNFSTGFGMHRLRFGDVTEHRWYNFELAATIPGRSYDIYLHWQYLFDTSWSEHQFNAALYRKIYQNLAIQLGTEIPTSLKDSLIPYLMLTVAL